MVIELLRRADGATIVDLTRSNGMAAAHDAGGAHRAAQTRVCRDPRTDRRWRFNLPDLGCPCSHGRLCHTAARRDGWPRAEAQGEASGVVGMTPARGNSGRAAKRPVAATPGASLPLDASVLSIVANLEGLDLNGLRRQWRAHLGGEAACPSPALAFDESAGLPAPVRRIRRSRQIDPKDPSLWERGWRRRSFRPPRASDARAAWV